MQETYKVRLNNMVRIPQTRFANKVVFALKQFVRKHTRAKDANIRFSNEVNAKIWERGMNYKLNSIDILLKKKEDMIYVFLKDGKEAAAFDSKQKAGTKTAKKEAPAKAEGKKETPAKAETKTTPVAKKESAEAKTVTPATEKKTATVAKK